MMLTMQEGRDFCHELVITAVDEVTVKNAAAFNETVSTDLQQRCPVFFSRGDFFFFRGVEYIRRALHDDSENEKRYFLQQSLSQFQQASDQISEAHISSICSFYQAQSFHVGVVELMLDRAQKLDPQQQALAVFESGGQGDEASKALYDARTKAYNYIFLALKDARSLLQPKVDMSRRVPIADKAVYVKQVFESALQNKDPLFHYKLYYWYINENMMDELLAVDTEFLVPFFSKVVQDEYISLNFLWQYYRGKTQFYKSAICLTRLAEMPNDQITLEARMKYLAYARVNCRCGEKETDISNYTRVQLAERIDTRMNTCRLQIRIQNILKNSGNIDAIAAAKELDYQLFDDEHKLYSYAERFPQLQDLFKSI
ncbi:hypothetical protein RMCBS344292_10788 [Rhizopus microsporus]|nr:hypothetical protein RMCBS344292_10788 [Rhizopus microsporus]